jgi:hypothetical protein
MRHGLEQSDGMNRAIVVMLEPIDTYNLQPLFPPIVLVKIDLKDSG